VAAIVIAVLCCVLIAVVLVVAFIRRRQHANDGSDDHDAAEVPTPMTRASEYGSVNIIHNSDGSSGSKFGNYGRAPALDDYGSAAPNQVIYSETKPPVVYDKVMDT